jgi:hypothetical protein
MILFKVIRRKLKTKVLSVARLRLVKSFLEALGIKLRFAAG